MISPYIKLARPLQWVKNGFLLIPIFFAGEIFDLDKLIPVIYGVFIFCLTSSAVYILNDIKDIKMDRLHEEKKKRPLASGEASMKVSIGLMLVLGISSLVLSYLLDVWFFRMVLLYIFINVIYSFGLKKISIIDLLLVAFGFIIRTVSGGILSGVEISNWLLIIIFLLSLFLVIAKRRDDLLIFNASGVVLRKSIINYNMEFINAMISMLSAIIIVCYIMYTVSSEIVERLGSDYLYATSIFVIIGLIRYLQITMVENKSGSPVKVLYSDRFIHITIFLWILSFFLILYVLKV